MCEIGGFSAIRFATRAGDHDITTKLAPPYDVLDEADKQALISRDPANFVRIDLPHTPPKHAGPPEAYAAARRQLEAWLADGTLVRDEKPGIYVYHQSFEHAGAKFTRKMFFARLRLEPFGKGSVYPHEQTFGGPKEDRLCLMKATRTSLSPIFGLYPDSANAVAQRLERALSGAPLASGGLDGTHNAIWAIHDPAVIADATRMLHDKPLFIADGHHRYGTAMLYRDALAQERGPLPADHAANFALCVFCAMEDPGLLILPTHRVLPGVQVSAKALREDPALEVADVLVNESERVPRALAKFGPQAVGLFSAADSGFLMVRPKDAGLLDTLEPARSHAWRRLGLAFLHAYLLDRLITPNLCRGSAPQIHYVKAAAAAVKEARDTDGSVFLLQPTTMEELRSVCQAGDLMPQKSTFFYPKLASGLVAYPLE